MVDQQIYMPHSPSGYKSRLRASAATTLVSVYTIGQKLFFRTLFLILLALTVSVIALTSMLAKQGSETQDIDRVISTLELENKDLRLAIASASSLATIRVKAERLGLSDRGVVAVDLLSTSLALKLQQ